MSRDQAQTQRHPQTAYRHSDCEGRRGSRPRNPFPPSHPRRPYASSFLKFTWIFWTRPDGSSVSDHLGTHR